MKIHFPVSECTFLRYFIPVAIEAKGRGHDPVFSFHRSNKYSDPHVPVNKKYCDYMLKHYGFGVDNTGDVTICIEGVKANDSSVNYALTYMYDFFDSYKNYINKVNHVVFPSEYFAKVSGCLSDKNLYFGSPKYDVTINPAEVYTKYGLNPEDKHALFVYPRARDYSKINVREICDSLVSYGYVPIIKTRGKDPVDQKYKCFRNFSDESWFPHLSMELITISDKIVNTGSSMIKEIVMLGKENVVMNYNIKPSSSTKLSELYEKGAREKYLNVYGKASEKILDHIEKNYG